MAILTFKGNAKKKIIYDEMYESSFYLADRIAIGMGIFYSFDGQN